jgi:Flp pilus assembly protein TadD
MDEAVAELKKAGEMDPQLEDPPYTLGILYMQLGKLDEAVVEMRKALRLRPDNGNAWAILGSTLKQAERLPEAKDALEKAIALQPGQPGPMVNMAGVLAEMAAKLGPEAEAAQSAGDEAKAAQLRGQMKEMRAQAADWRKRGAVLSQAAVNRQRASFLLNAGNQLLLKGKIADAVGRYQESIAADGTFAEPHTQLAVAYERQGRAQEAAAERAKAGELSAAK